MGLNDTIMFLKAEMEHKTISVSTARKTSQRGATSSFRKYIIILLLTCSFWIRLLIIYIREYFGNELVDYIFRISNSFSNRFDYDSEFYCCWVAGFAYIFENSAIAELSH